MQDLFLEFSSVVYFYVLDSLNTFTTADFMHFNSESDCGHKCMHDF